jgi:hypothetical protein
VTVKKRDLPALSDLEREHLNELIKEFKEQAVAVRMTQQEAGKIARELKPLYARSGRKGGWRRFIEDECGLKVRTVDEWILDYEREAGFRKLAETKPPRGNVAESARFHSESTAQVVVNEEPDKNGRVAVGAIFVLEKNQREPFLAALRKLKPEEATRLMYEALVRDGQP